MVQTMNLSVAEIVSKVRCLVAKGNIQEAWDAAVLLESCKMSTLGDLRLAIALVLDIHRTGSAEVLFFNYFRDFPDDSEAQLDRVEMHAKWYLNKGTKAQAMLEEFRPETFGEYKRVAELWTRLGHSGKAAQIYKYLISLEPSNMNCRSALVHALIRNRQPKSAREAIKELRRVMPDQAYWWAFISEQAAIAQDTKTFRDSVVKAEKRLGSKDDLSRLIIARAYGSQNDVRNVARVLGEFHIENINEVKILSGILKLAEDFNLITPQVIVSRHVVNCGNLDAELAAKCTGILRNQESIERYFPGLNQISYNSR